jgi:DNA invertase Pin-like site-specific DNA recombinase
MTNDPEIFHRWRDEHSVIKETIEVLRAVFLEFNEDTLRGLRLDGESFGDFLREIQADEHPHGLSLNRTPRVLKLIVHKFIQRQIEKKSEAPLRELIEDSFKRAVIDLTLLMKHEEAKREKQRMSESVIAGLRNARARGVRLGAKRVDASSEDVRKLVATGLSQRGIAAQLNISAATVCRLANRAQ